MFLPNVEGQNEEVTLQLNLQLERLCIATTLLLQVDLIFWYKRGGEAHEYWFLLSRKTVKRFLIWPLTAANPGALLILTLF